MRLKEHAAPVYTCARPVHREKLKSDFCVPNRASRPLEGLTCPEGLELCGALLLNQFSEQSANCFETHIIRDMLDRLHDSVGVYEGRWKTFVANRVTEILFPSRGD